MTLFYYCLTKVKLDLDVINLTKIDNTVDTKITYVKKMYLLNLKYMPILNSLIAFLIIITKCKVSRMYLIKCH